jgi:cyclopropane-fatty-acyl-phospholipid synthase
MKPSSFKDAAEELLSIAGININGSNPWDVKVHNDDLYKRAMTEGSLGLGEAYLDGWWDCNMLDEFFCRIFRAKLDEKVRGNKLLLLKLSLCKIFNMQSKRRALEVAERHYDLDYELFDIMLDSRKGYSCAYWQEAQTLDEAQEKKLELICRKLRLAPGMKILDVGCGWGSFAKYAAEKHGVEVTGITVSGEQVEHGQSLCKELPIDIRLQDYRDISGKFDHVVSVGMFEHVGCKNYKRFMKVIHDCIKEGGLFLLHTIGGNVSLNSIDPWINKYIFPNAVIPSVKQIGDAAEGLFVMEDWHNFSVDYDKTLMAWYENFDRNWHKISHRYDERFYRMWKYYLHMCAGSFRARVNQLWQIVLSKEGVPGGYAPSR